MSFHKGQRVVCIKDGFKAGSGEKTPVKGKVYTIRDIYFAEIKQCECLRLVEIVNTPKNYADIGYGECGFRSQFFRPLCESRIAVFKAMLVSSNVRTPA